MASYTYPVARPEGTLTPQQVHLLLGNARLVAKRAATLADSKFIADYLLGAPLYAANGGIFYETGEEIFAADSPESIEPGSGYPKTVLTEGELAAAKTDKRGLATDITDEKITRQGVVYVNRGFSRLTNSVIRDVDSRAMAVIASKVTATAAASAAWTTPGAVLETLLTQQGNVGDGTGIDLDTVVLKPSKFAKVVGMFVDKGVLPREQGNLIITGRLPFDAYGFTWVTSPRWSSDNPMMVDREQLGGMADEKIVSPEFARFGNSLVEASATRAATKDKWELRVRRATVGVVLEPKAGISITGTGL